MRCRKVGQISENRHFCFQSFLAAIGTEALSFFLLALLSSCYPGVAGSWDNTTQAPFLC